MWALLSHIIGEGICHLRSGALISDSALEVG